MVISVVFLPVRFSEFSENEKRMLAQKVCSRFFSDHLLLVHVISIVYFLMVNSCLLFASKHFMITTDVNQRQ